MFLCKWLLGQDQNEQMNIRIKAVFWNFRICQSFPHAPIIVHKFGKNCKIWISKQQTLFKIFLSGICGSQLFLVIISASGKCCTNYCHFIFKYKIWPPKIMIYGDLSLLVFLSQFKTYGSMEVKIKHWDYCPSYYCKCYDLLWPLHSFLH